MKLNMHQEVAKGFGVQILFNYWEIVEVQTNILFTYYDSGFNAVQSDGLLGLSNDKEIENLFDLAYKQGQINTTLFAMELKSTNEQSLFYYDDIPNEIMNNVEWVRVLKKDYWTVRVLNIQLDEDFMSTGKQKEALQYQIFDSSTKLNRKLIVIHKEFDKSNIIDSGTSLLYSQCFKKQRNNKNQQYLPENVVTEIYEKLILSNCRLLDGNVFCPCLIPKSKVNDYPKIKIYLEGIFLELDINDYMILDFEHQGQCYIGIEIESQTNLMIFGDIVMRKYVIVFDKQNNKIGFKGVGKLNNIETMSIFLIEIIGFGVIIISCILLQMKLIKL